MTYSALVCGAGTAGLGTAAALRRAGVSVQVLERSDRAGASWRSRYEALRLNTPGWLSSMPGQRATVRRYGQFPTRDGWNRYIDDYTSAQDIDVRYGVDITRIDKNAVGGWIVVTSAGEMRADVVVVALGMDHEPSTPAWPGSAGFTGQLTHSAAFQSAGDYRGRDVLVVGPNVSGSEIAHLLVEGGASRVRLACRTPPNLMRRTFLGLSVNLSGIVLNHVPLTVSDRITRWLQLLMFGRLDRYGIPRPPVGIATNIRVHTRGPAYDDGFVADLRSGRLEMLPAVIGFDGADVVLADDARIRPDAVIAATGYRCGLEPLVGHLGVLDDEGSPLVNGGEQHPAAQGLFFNGYRGDLSGQLRPMRIAAKSIAKTVRLG